jgi:signal transduction histidine kinase
MDEKPPGGILMVTNDLERFRQVLYQLLSNAVRFTQNGTITIEVQPI